MNREMQHLLNSHFVLPGLVSFANFVGVSQRENVGSGPLKKKRQNVEENIST